MKTRSGYIAITRDKHDYLLKVLVSCTGRYSMKTYYMIKRLVIIAKMGLLFEMWNR